MRTIGSWLKLVGVGFLAAALGALAATPSGRYLIDGRTAYDTTSRLTWNRDIRTALSLADAVTYCGDLSLNGFDDWRLPTTKELESLVDVTIAYPSIDATVFAGTPNTYFWSSTPLSFDTGTWVVSFGDGWTYEGGASLKAARCVRP